MVQIKQGGVAPAFPAKRAGQGERSLKSQDRTGEPFPWLA